MQNLAFQTQRGILILVLIVCSISPLYGATVGGQLVDAVTGNPVADANITISGSSEGTSSDLAGRFSLEVNSDIPSNLTITHLGYHSVDIDLSNNFITVKLTPNSIRRSEVIVTPDRTAGVSARSTSNIDRNLVELSYGAQDVPLLVAQTPSATAFSWSGSSVGASSMKIRGFDQTRLGISVNGIPINDPEDHDVYWQDTPDFLSNTHDLQIERGVSSFMSGSGGMGGGLNLSTSDAVSNREFALTYQGGKFNTHRRSLAYRSGLVNTESKESSYNFTGRFSQVSTDGYRDHTSANMWSYFLGATRYDPNMITRLQVYGGQEEMDAYWWGLDKNTLEANRKANYSAWNKDYHEEFFWDPSVDYEGERDFFQQPHYVLHNQWKISDNLQLNESLFWIEGDGFYEEYKLGRKFSEYNLSPFNRIFDEDEDGILDTVEISRTDLIRRKYVEKDHFGWLPRLNWKVNSATSLDAGLELRFYRSDHYGRIMWARELPNNASPEHEWFRWTGDKDYIGGYINIDHQFSSKLKLNAGLQVQQITYKVDQELMGAFPGYEYELDWTFLNPRLGLTYQFNDQTSLYTTFAMKGREPIDSQIYDADNPNGVPKLTKYGQTEIDPEQMLDVEFGGTHNLGDLHIGVNLYAMFFTDEIVSTGFSSTLDEEVYDNAPTSSHIGIEIDGGWNTPMKGLVVDGNISYGKATLGDYTIDHVAGLDDDWNPLIEQVNLEGNQIAGFPNLIANIRSTYSIGMLTTSLHLQHVGMQFMDNREDDNASLDPYTLLDGVIQLKLAKYSSYFGKFDGIDLEIRGMNLLDSEYEPHGVVDVEYGTPYYVPAAGRSYLAGITIRL